jgi:biopolymer transport protein TolR
MRQSGRFKRVKKPLKSDMNVVPYIDVMLVLLVIFMVTAPMITSGIQVDLPKANATPLENKSPPAIVTLNQDGQYLLKYQDYNNDQTLSLAELEAALHTAQSQQQEQNSELTVVINGEQSRPYGEVISLMNHLQNAGLSKVALLTEPVS